MSEITTGDIVKWNAGSGEIRSLTYSGVVIESKVENPDFDDIIKVDVSGSKGFGYINKEDVIEHNPKRS